MLGFTTPIPMAKMMDTLPGFASSDLKSRAEWEAAVTR